MAGGAVGSGMREGEEHLFAIGREDRLGKSFQVAQVFVGGKTGSRRRRGGNGVGLCGGAERNSRENEADERKNQRSESEHGDRIQRRSGVSGVSSASHCWRS